MHCSSFVSEIACNDTLQFEIVGQEIELKIGAHEKNQGWGWMLIELPFSMLMGR